MLQQSASLVLWRRRCRLSHTGYSVEVSVDSMYAVAESRGYGSCEFARRRPMIDTVARIEDASYTASVSQRLLAGMLRCFSGRVWLLFGHETGL